MLFQLELLWWCLLDRSLPELSYPLKKRENIKVRQLARKNIFFPFVWIIWYQAIIQKSGELSFICSMSFGTYKLGTSFFEKLPAFKLQLLQFSNHTDHNLECDDSIDMLNYPSNCNENIFKYFLNWKLTCHYRDGKRTTCRVATCISKGVCDSSVSDRKWAARSVGPAGEGDSSWVISCCGISVSNRYRCCSNLNCYGDVCWTGHHWSCCIH